ncbi:hypothetical protein [Seonamhaeicola maritimus]|uniref:hypothetical protein n=1 Tax=Seonamhaeicola maritimus TaxID=2591822 RepID=UPI002494A247|nr:hypothetical protein [Seonamhaeicola maritimus]
MKYLCLLIALLSVCFQLNAQKSEFVFNKELNNLIALKEGASPYVFEVLLEEHTTSIKKPSTKRISEFYKKALVYADKARKDIEKIEQLKKELKLTPQKLKELNVSEVYNRLRTAERVLKNTKKYEIIPSNIIFQKHEDLKMRRSIFKPQNIVVGKFKYLGEYYVTKDSDGYKERNLISVANAQKNRLTNEQFFLQNVFQVIQNVRTNVIYMVYPDFLQKYPINKVASQKKYKGKISLSSNYSSDIDKKLDAIITSYNRSLLN